jgi:type I restriction enzyme S subunit
VTAHLAVEAVASRLPAGWAIAPFRRLAVERGARNARLSEQSLSLSSTGVLYDRTEESDRQFASELSARNAWVVQPGDLVVNPMWLNGGAIGVSNRRGAVSPDYRVYYLSPLLEPRFVHHLLRSSPYRDQYRLYMRAETTFDRRITKDDFEEMPIVVPPRAVQRAVADYLDAATTRVDGLLERRNEVRRLVAEREEAAIRSTVMGAAGERRPISALASYINGFPFKPEDFTVTGLPVIRIRQLVDPEADQDLFDGPVPARVRLSDGDLVFSWSASLEVRIWNRGPAILNQHLFRVVPAPGIERDWLRWVLHVARSDFRELMHGSTMMHITKPMMRDVRVPLPDTDAQRDVADAANRIHAKSAELLDALDQQARRLAEARHALITAAVTGQLEIPGVAA